MHVKCINENTLNANHFKQNEQRDGKRKMQKMIYKNGLYVFLDPNQF